MDDLCRDIRFGFRLLVRRPGFALVAIFTLALGIGANGAIFGFIKKVFSNPLPYRSPERLVVLWQDYRPRGGPEREWFSYASFLDYRAQTRTLADLAVYEDALFIVTGSGEAEALAGEFVSPSVFDLLGVRFALGRGFRPAEGQYGGPAAAVLGYDLWQRRYGGDPGVIGQRLVVDGRPHAVVGVLPADFYFPLAPGAQLFTAMQVAPSVQADHDNLSLRTVGRLAPGVRLAQARASLRGATVDPLRRALLGPVEPALLLLLASAGCLLLLACANVAHLLLARTTARRGEIGVRMALGAAPARLVRQLLTESVLLALPGGGLGLALAAAAVPLLKRLGAAASFPLPRLETVAVDGAVLGFTLLLSVLAGLLCGLAPALALRRTEVRRELAEPAGAPSGRTAGRRAGRALVVAEVALALLLAVGSGLMLSSLRRLSAVDTGYDARGLLAFRLQAPPARYPENRHVAAFYARLIATLQGLPGVTSVGAVSTLPLADNGTDIVLAVQGRPAAGAARRSSFWYRSTSPGYFRTARLSVLRGRGIEERDQPGQPKVVVINRSAARQYFPGEDPLGHVLTAGPLSLTIVGVVQNARSVSLTDDEPPALYVPLAQLPLRFMGLVVRSSGDPAALAGPVRAAVRRLDPSAATLYLRPLTETVRAALAPAQALGALLTAFAILAAVLAAVGIYGWMTYAASRRARELGIRMAVGAGGGAIGRLVLGPALALTAAGIGLGLLAALFLTRRIAGALFEVGPFDPLSFLVSVAVLAAVALAAGGLPAWQASRRDPARALRR